MIIGGGFGGFFTALALERAARRGGPALDVTLINDSNAMVYTPFLPQAAGGTLEPRHVVVPLRGPLRTTTLLVGAATGHDAEARTIAFRSDAGDERTIPYDHLVAAPGSVSRTLPVPGLREAALGFKTVAEAIALRNRALQQLEMAEGADNAEERAAHLTFVFVGGGYAGVEALAEVEDLIRDAKRLHPALRATVPASCWWRPPRRSSPRSASACRRTRCASSTGAASSCGWGPPSPTRPAAA